MKEKNDDDRFIGQILNNGLEKAPDELEELVRRRIIHYDSYSEEVNKQHASSLMNPIAAGLLVLGIALLASLLIIQLYTTRVLPPILIRITQILTNPNFWVILISIVTLMFIDFAIQHKISKHKISKSA